MNMNKEIYATKEEMLDRKKDLFYQNRGFAKDIEIFSEFLQIKKEKPCEKPNEHYWEGINSLTNFLRNAKEGLKYDETKATEGEKSKYTLFKKKHVDRVKLLAKDKEDKNNLDGIITDLSNLILDLRKGIIIEKDNLEFYYHLMESFHEVIFPDNDWYRKSKNVD